MLACYGVCPNESHTSNSAFEADAIYLSVFRDRPDRPDPADFTIENEEGSTKGRLPGKIDGQQFMIRNCKVRLQNCVFNDDQMNSSALTVVLGVSDKVICPDCKKEQCDEILYKDLLTVVYHSGMALKGIQSIY